MFFQNKIAQLALKAFFISVAVATIQVSVFNSGIYRTDFDQIRAMSEMNQDVGYNKYQDNYAYVSFHPYGRLFNLAVFLDREFSGGFPALIDRDQSYSFIYRIGPKGADVSRFLSKKSLMLYPAYYFWLQVEKFKGSTSIEQAGAIYQTFAWLNNLGRGIYLWLWYFPASILLEIFLLFWNKARDRQNYLRELTEHSQYLREKILSEPAQKFLAACAASEKFLSQRQKNFRHELTALMQHPGVSPDATEKEMAELRYICSGINFDTLCQKLQYAAMEIDSDRVNRLVIEQRRLQELSKIEQNIQTCRRQLAVLQQSFGLLRGLAQPFPRLSGEVEAISAELKKIDKELAKRKPKPDRLIHLEKRLSRLDGEIKQFQTAAEVG